MRVISTLNLAAPFKTMNQLNPENSLATTHNHLALREALSAPSTASERKRKSKLLRVVPESSPVGTRPLANDPLLCKMELPLRAVFYPLGFAVEISTNSQAVLDAAKE